MSEFDPALQAWRFRPPALGATVRPAVLGMAAALTREANAHGISNPVRVDSPWGR